MNWKVYLVAVAILAVIASVVYILCFSPYLKIKDIRVEGTQKISGNEIINLSKQALSGREHWIIPKDSVVFFNGTKLKGFLLKQASLIKSVDVVRSMSGLLVIKIQERQKAILFCDAQKCYNIDDGGLIFEEAPAIYGGMAVALKDNSGREAKVGDSAVGAELVSFIKEARRLLNERVNLNLIYFEIGSHPSAEVNAITVEDWKIIFDPNRDAGDQIAALKLVLDDQIKEQRDNLEYIDLRVNNRVYFKYRGVAVERN